MNETSIRIAQFLAERAGKKMRATYPMVAEEIGWGFSTGFGLGDYLYEILHYCADHGLPPLTTILVKSGEKYPGVKAMEYIHAALGEIDLDAAQNEVFQFDWVGIFGDTGRSSRDEITGTVEKNEFWLTSTWGWSPREWGCLGFTHEWMRDKFVAQTKPGVIVAIYVSGNPKADKQLKGRIAGFYEISHQEGHLYDFIDERHRDVHERDPDQRTKWIWALRASRAWDIDLSQPPSVEEVLPGFVSSETALQIGSRGMPITEPDHIANILKLPVVEVPVFGGAGDITSQASVLSREVKISRAIYPPKEPYFVAETDGPKHIYILRLSCSAEEWCEEGRQIPQGAGIIKVGFSKSPRSRKRQIQAAYPQGRFNWEIVHPDPIPKMAPYKDAKTAIAGEDAMKLFLGAESHRILGGEFFLANENEIKQAWDLGSNVAVKAMKIK